MIVRDGYRLHDWQLDGQGQCTACGTRQDGVYAGLPGQWGERRLRVRLDA